MTEEMLNELEVADIPEWIEIHEDGSLEDKPKRRLKTPRKEVDWPALIAILMKDTGATYDELSEATGISASQLNAIRREIREPDSLTRALNLFIVFWNNTERKIPYVGEHHQF